ncbi:synaptotagmin-14-like [Megalops cyprinoides]|uniref:synaptotagmin-14-like n=1 Tax=Megalops cyprinoides TaxID=118141 RepID=UPI001864BFF9|nr:synaptotagmin-14-like [Megalops cyprinoides]
MAIDGRERSCGVHELICARRVSPEVLVFLSTIGVFTVLTILLLLYVSSKLSVETAGDLPCLDELRSSKTEQEQACGLMAFFRSFQQNLPSVSSILDSVSSAVDDLASAVGDVTYTVSDQLAEQVTTLINKVQTEEEENSGKTEALDSRAGEQDGGGRKIKQQAPSGRCRDPEARSEERTAKSSCSPQTVARSQGKADGGRGEGRRSTQSTEESNALEEGVWCHSRKHRDNPENNPEELDGSAGGSRGHDPKETVPSSFTGRATRRGKQAGDEVCHSNSTREKPPPNSKASKDKRKNLTKEHSIESEEERGAEKTASDSKRRDEEPRPPQSGREGEDSAQEKAARDAGSGKAPHRRDRGELGSGTRNEKSRGNPGKDGDLQEPSSSEGEGGGRRKQAESAARSQAELHGKAYGWETQQKYSPQSRECAGYSSEASTEEANCIQRISRTPPPEEPQPPPYQDQHGATRKPAVHLGTRHSNRAGNTKRHSLAKHPSDGSEEEQAESPLTQHREEDPPSDSTAVVGLEDASAPGSELHLSEGYEPEPLAKYGTLDVAFDYDSGEQRLAVTVTAATDIPALRRMANVSWQVHLVLLPTKQQRAKTGVQKGPCPVFTETFKFSCVESDTIGSYAVRFRLYSVRRMRKERVMGEKVFYLTKLNLQGKMSVPVALDPGCTLTGCGSVRSLSYSDGAASYRSAEQDSRPEILLGLVYSSTTGRLSVEIIKGSHFRTAPDKPPNGFFCCLKHLIGGQLYIVPDTYVKLTMMNSMGQEMSRCKTSTCRGQPDPTYKETFVFQVALFQLSEVTLLLSVYSRRGVRRRDRVGWLSLGLNSSGAVETSHWAQMKQAEGQQVCRWHTLLGS